jgi:hypothetical protein
MMYGRSCTKFHINLLIYSILRFETFLLFLGEIIEFVHKEKSAERIREESWRYMMIILGPCFLSNWKEMSNLYRGLSIEASYQVGSFGQAVSEEKIFRNRPTRNKNWLWQPCFLVEKFLKYLLL